MVKKKLSSFLKKHLTLILFSTLLLLLGFFFYKKLIIFSLILAISTFLNFASYKLDIRLNFGHVFFLSMLIIRKIGVLESIIYILVAEFFPRIANTDIDMKSLILVPLEILFVLSLLIFPVEITKIGIVLAIIYHVLGFFIAKFFGDTLIEILSEIGVSLLLNIVYFVSLSGPLVSLIGNVVK